MNNLPTKYIPINKYYCYERLEIIGNTYIVVGECPYWNRTAEYSGSCAYLDYDEADYDEVPLIFDQVKICGQNDDGCDFKTGEALCYSLSDQPSVFN